MRKPTNFATCVSEYFMKHLVETKNLSENTIVSYRDTFCLLLIFMNEYLGEKIETIKLEDVNDNLILLFLDWLETERKNGISTRNQRLAAIHAFFRYVQLQHPDKILQCQRILSIPVKRNTKETIEYLPEKTIEDILSLPDQTTKYGIRDAALLSLLYDSGARVQELINLSLNDVRLDAPATVKLLGKGRKARTVPVMNQTAKLLNNYILRWSLDIKRTPDVPLFCNHSGDRLTRPGITYIINKYSTKAGWNDCHKNVTPHIFRHSKAMHLLRAGVDLHYIRDFLGHVNIETTETYARADSEMKRKAFEDASLEVQQESQTSWQKNSNLLSWLKSL